MTVNCEIVADAVFVASHAERPAAPEVRPRDADLCRIPTGLPRMAMNAPSRRRGFMAGLPSPPAGWARIGGELGVKRGIERLYYRQGRPLVGTEVAASLR
ncbi:MAG: hypothetical protein Tsb0010_05580 [Parvularculaceae bacterium]